MENTSKALLIAAAILIVTILITFGISILNSADDTAKQAQGVGDSLSLATKDSTSKLESLLSGLGGGSSRLNHSGIIPEGGKYISKNGTTYNAGEKMPSPQTGDTYTYTDYKYTLESSGWNVDVTNTTKSTYGDILESINGNNINSMYQTFMKCHKLEVAPKIPKTVTNLRETFYMCWKLEKAPEIPDGVTTLRGTFKFCIALKEAPSKIPNGVKSLESTFEGCKLLEKVPEIPNSVTNLHYTFDGCESLKKAPTIPSSPIASIMYAFYGCTSLEGELEINIPNNANAQYSYDGFLGNTSKNIKITGSCSDILKERFASTAKGGNVTWE